MKHHIQIMLVFAFLMALSCENKIQKELQSFYNQAITIPINMQCFEGEKYEFVNWSINRPKIVIWYDSTECGSCKIKNLPAFKHFESYCQDLKYDLDLVFLFSPSRQNVRQTLEEASISTKLHDYPIYIDTANQFYKLNPHIPANKLMHSFLLDSESKVVLVGNPIQNQAMFDLYKKTIEEMMN